MMAEDRGGRAMAVTQPPMAKNQQGELHRSEDDAR